MALGRSLFRDLSQLLNHLSRRRKRQLVFLLLLMLGSALSEVVSLGMVLPFLGALSNAPALLGNPKLQPLLQVVGVSTVQGLVTVLAIAFIFTAITANVLRIVTIYAQTHLAAAIGSDLSCELYRRTLLQPYRFHVQKNSSDLINLITSDSAIVVNSVLTPLLALLTNVLITIGLIVGLCFIHSKVALFSTVILGGTYIFLYRWKKSALQRNSQVIVSSDQQKIKAIQEGIGGIREVLLDGTQAFFQSLYEPADRQQRRASADNLVTYITPRYGIEMMAMIAIAAFAIGLGQGDDFGRAIPVLGALALGGNRLLPALQQSFVALAGMQGSRVSLHRVLEGLDRPVHPLLQVRSTQSLPFTQELRFEDVWFRYLDDQAWVLKGLDFAIQAKTTVGFVGATGSGKSTTADLILGLLQPDRGRLSVDGQPLEGETLRAWQGQIAHVPQSIFLTDATIAENIAFGVPKEQIDGDRIQEAAHLARIADFIHDLPAGYDTFVGERGIRLSGGQRQRIGIARALYRQATVIVFDEATSALDNATEKEVMEAIHGLSNQLTMILIAHRLTTVERCDRIFEFSQGTLVHSGTYQTLLDQSESFRRMSAQSLA